MRLLPLANTKVTRGNTEVQKSLVQVPRTKQIKADKVMNGSINPGKNAPDTVCGLLPLFGQHLTTRNAVLREPALLSRSSAARPREGRKVPDFHKLFDNRVCCAAGAPPPILASGLLRGGQNIDSCLVNCGRQTRSPCDWLQNTPPSCYRELS